MVAFISGSEVTWGFSGSSNSASRAVHASAEFAMLCLSMWNGSGDTLAATLGGASPDITYQASPGGADTAFWAGWLSPATGTPTVVVSGGDGGDVWDCCLTSWTDVDTSTPWDNTAVDTGSPNSIDVGTTSDGVAVAQLWSDGNPTLTSGTLIVEHQGDIWQSVAQSAGTGGSVTFTWTASGANISSGLNLRNAAGGGGGLTPNPAAKLIGL